MSKIGLMVCAHSGIDYIKHKYDITVIRSILFLGNEEFTDFVDITADEFYKRLLENPSLTPSTAQAATGVILEQYEELRDKGFDEILVVTISNKLSGTYEGCMMAANMIENCKVTVFDSKSVAYPEAKMIFDAAAMVEDGKEMPEILEHLEYIRNNHVFWIAVDTLRYLVKNGRLSGASGFIGSLLRIKPLLWLSKEGKIESLEKIRTSMKATNRVIEVFLKKAEGKNIEPFIVHANAPERVEYIRNKLAEKDPKYKDIKAYPLTPVVGAHAGPGTLCLGYIVKK